MSRKILCVDDDENMRDLVVHQLMREGYDAFSVADEQAAFIAMQDFAPDLILLDMILENGDGISILREMNARGIEIPVIMVSGRSEDIDKIIGIEAGADDYLSKPYNVRELIARIRAVLRRADSMAASEDETVKNKTIADKDQLSFDGWILDRKRYQVYDAKTNDSANLTTHEFMVLEKLISAPKQVFEREQLFVLLNNRSMDVNDRAIDIQMSRIRTKLKDDPKTPNYIRTVRGVGYMFCCDVE